MNGRTAVNPDQRMLLGDVEDGFCQAVEQGEQGEPGHAQWSWGCLWAEIV